MSVGWAIAVDEGPRIYYQGFACGIVPKSFVREGERESESKKEREPDIS